MEFTSLTAAGKLVMMILCLCGMPEGKDSMWIEVLSDKGVVEMVVAKPTADGFAIFENNKDGAEKLMDINRDGSSTSFVSGKHKIELKEIFPEYDFKRFSIVSSVALKDTEGGTFKVTRSGSGSTVYVTSPSGITYSIHK